MPIGESTPGAVGLGAVGLGDVEQVVDALDSLARVEHSLLVEYLTIYCALGRGMATPGDTASQGARETIDAVNAAASTMFELALAEMTHLRRVNAALTLAARPPQTGRASGIAVGSEGSTGSELSFDPLSAEQLSGFLDREDVIAAAVEARYAGLRPAVTSPGAVLDGELLDQVSFLLDTCADHAARVGDVRAALDGIAPADFLRAIRREPQDDLERTLLRLSDEYYAVVVDTVRGSFGFDDELGGQLRNRAITTMDSLNEVNALLVERGLLPGFQPVVDD